MNYINNIVCLFFSIPFLLVGQNLEWHVSANDFEHSMSLTCVVMNQENLFMTQSVLIGVFNSDGSCVGLGTSDTYFQPIEANLGFITVFGNQLEDSLFIKVVIGDVIYDAGSLIFVSNDILGTFELPYIISPSFNGCTDEFALNYNSAAIVDDGSCELINEGCTDTDAFNYSSAANTDDGSCIPFYFGCYNNSFIEYDINANFGNQEEFCVTEIIFGCTDDCFVEFDSTANTNNGSCFTTWQQAYFNIINEYQEASTSIQVDIAEGWNLIGFTMSIELDVEIALDCIIEKIIIVKNNSGEAYWPTFNFNGIGSFIPGMGYQIKINQSISEFNFCN